MRRCIALALLCSALLVGCSDPTVATITREEYGEAWPFTVEEAKLRCFRNGEVIVQTSTDVYALNGIARRRYDPIDPIWRDNPALPGTKIPVGDLIARGNRMCER